MFVDLYIHVRLTLSTQILCKIVQRHFFVYYFINSFHSRSFSIIHDLLIVNKVTCVHSFLRKYFCIFLNTHIEWCKSDTADR